jgi:hypothetical protein
MSSIPNSAMPHAAPTAETEESESGGQGLVARATGLVRDNPKTALAAGAAVAAGVATAAVVRARRGGSSSAGGSKSGGGSSKGGKKSS